MSIKRYIRIQAKLCSNLRQKRPPGKAAIHRNDVQEEERNERSKGQKPNLPGGSCCAFERQLLPQVDVEQYYALGVCVAL